MEETAPQALAQPATVARPQAKLILQQLARNIQAGVKLAANVLQATNQAEIPTLNSTTPTALTMLVYGKSIARTGLHATVVQPLVVLMLTLPVPRRSLDGEAIPGNSGLLAELAAAAERLWKRLSSVNNLRPLPFSEKPS